MKKLGIIIVTFLTMLSYSLSINALDSSPIDEAGTLEEYVDNSGIIYRRYTKNIQASQPLYTSTSSSLQTEKNTYIKDILSLLGLSESFINELSTDKLNMYANAQSITCITTYSVSDQDGNVTIIPKEIALQNINSIAKLPPTFPEDFDDGYGDLDSEFGTYSDEYMSITYLVAELGNGRYNHSVNATWLTLPFFRYRDLIGACVENNSVDSSTFSGWYKYRTHYTVAGTNDVITTTSFTTNNFYSSSSNGWTGCGAIFELQSDPLPLGDNELPLLYHLDFEAHFEFESTVPNPTSSSSFDSTATYDHATLINNNKTAKLITSNGRTYIGLDMLNINVDRRRVILPNELTYTP